MAKHRLEQSGKGARIAQGAMVAGTLTLGGVAIGAGPALATPVAIPGVGTFELPGVNEKQVPNQFKPGKVAPGPIKGLPKLPPRANSEGQVAADAAVSKIGAPYSYGSAGPSAFDCSGLVQWAYKQAGKTIPRDSYGQLGGGAPVPASALEPGDVLIFNGGSHAGIYVGGGKFVHASTEGVPVQKASLGSMELTGARRY
ncbi:C40 family peptidase [Williamsia sterculiae]|uniref:Cell wall-associated hydrolase, NlpC family n=1 Tax=Williamsia sterculiae TaxID=1344003 RepID=A0A1N7H7E5_9NOCA|nr:C40 family peptidase [Williamsia sterculiae]SIS20794.1 Cell wall-associated hydrolase, NlpC family [Williamsia sterculiae]